MADGPPFRDLVRRVRAGDPRAAAELVRLYEPALRTVVRRRLADPALRRLLDSVDICQSVLASFFVRAAAGQYELDTPEQLLKLLATMARNKLVDQVLKQRAARRQPPRGQPEEGDVGAVVDPAPGPGQVVAHRELLQEFRRRLSDAERQLADQRALGRSWAEIATQVGGNADTLRLQLRRAVERVSRELGLEA
jgi:RNA polymerase sigma-70 factor (ECF subfamily)